MKDFWKIWVLSLRPEGLEQPPQAEPRALCGGLGSAQRSRRQRVSMAQAAGRATATKQPQAPEQRPSAVYQDYKEGPRFGACKRPLRYVF